MIAQPSLCGTRSKTQKTGILTMRLNYCKPTCFCRYLFSLFCLNGYVCDNLFSRTVKLNYSRTMNDASSCRIFSWQSIFMSEFLYRGNRQYKSLTKVNCFTVFDIFTSFFFHDRASVRENLKLENFESRKKKRRRSRLTWRRQNTRPSRGRRQ